MTLSPHCGCWFKKIAMFVLWSAVLLLAAGTAHAQTVTVSPSNLTFGIPTGTSPAVSAAQAATVNITGTGTVSFTTPPSTTTAAFSVNGNSCQGTLTAPTTCQVSVVFTSGSSTLQTDTLSIPVNIPTAETSTTLTVALSGAFGAIKLFDPTTVQVSLNGVGFTNLYNIGATSLNLSCPAVPTAFLSSGPGYVGQGEFSVLQNVLVDNYIDLAIDGKPVSTTIGNAPASPPGNVCTGSDASPDNNTYPECFSAAYRTYVGTILGQSSDLFVNGGLPGGAAGGIPALDISGFFPTLVEGTQQSVQASISMVDAGGFVASSTLFLVTNCSLAGVTPGGTITGNPITGNTGSQTQTFSFDSSPGQNISFTTSEAVAIQQGTSAATGVVPIVTDIGISQSDFSTVIAGTSAAPAVCLRMTGEMDASGNELCKGFLLQCYNPTTGTVSGDNCDTQTSAALVRNLFDSVQFSSPDAPVGGNFLFNGGTDACTFFLAQKGIANGTCAPSSSPGPNPATLIGPGLLLGGDNWLVQPLNGANCAFTVAGTLGGDLCPLDTLTQFKGAADPLGSGTTGGRNSVYVAVVNKPLPFTNASIAGRNASGWVNSANVTANFVSNTATYNPSAANPPANGFIAAASYSLTFGYTPASQPVPDTTYPVPGDVTNYNGGTVNPNFVKPICGPGTPGSFASDSGNTLHGLAEGIYNLHYFTTDCALTEELLFNPTAAQLTDPTANWASFPVLQFGVDITSPVLSCSSAPAAPNGSHGWYLTDVVENCSATDPGYVAGSTGSGFPPVTKGIQGSSSEVLAPIITNVGAGNANPAAVLPLAQAADLAGNLSNSFGPYALPIDEASPTISSSFSVAGNSFGIGSNVQITYSCKDVGSGVANCNGQVPAACPAAPAMNPGSFSYAQPVDTSAAAFGPHSYAIAVTDCAGNPGQNMVNYTITAPSADVAIFEQETSDKVKPGGTLTYLVWALDLNPSASAYGVNISESLPANVIAPGAAVSASVAHVSCTLLTGCSAMVSGAACNVSGGNIVCNVGTLPSVFTGKGALVKITVPVSSSVAPGSVFKINAGVTSDNDPNTKNNTTYDTITVVAK